MPGRTARTPLGLIRQDNCPEAVAGKNGMNNIPRVRAALAAISKSSKAVTKKVWFREGTVHRCLIGPYAGLKFQISEDQLASGRMEVFYRAFEPEVTELFAGLVRPGLVVVDVGANIGVHTLYLAKQLRGRGKVYAFEPWPDNFRALMRNVSLNCSLADIVVLRQEAVAEKIGRSYLLKGSSTGSHHLGCELQPDSVEVDLVTLDSIWADGAETPTIIKVDVEGEELRVLHGAEKLIQKAKPKLILEHHGDGRLEVLRDWLKQRAYKLETVGPRHLFAS